jgi:hypothetical protein
MLFNFHRYLNSTNKALVIKHDSRKALWKPRRTYEDNTNIELKERRWETGLH